MASIYTSPSPVLKELQDTFNLIPCSLTNNVKACLIDKEALFLWTNFAERLLIMDGYIAARKLLDHFWRKWIFSLHRPAIVLVLDNSVKTSDPIITPTKDLEVDYLDISSSMTAAQGKDWKNAGFTFIETKSWIDAGIESTNTLFAKWLVDKGGNDYNTPKRFAANVDKNGKKKKSDLKTEARTANVTVV